MLLQGCRTLATLAFLLRHDSIPTRGGKARLDPSAGAVAGLARSVLACEQEWQARLQRTKLALSTLLDDAIPISENGSAVTKTYVDASKKLC